MGFTAEHLHHRQPREALNAYFSQSSIFKLEHRIATQVKQLCKRFEEACSQNATVSLTVSYLALTIAIIMVYALGRSTWLLHKEFSNNWWKSITTIMHNTALMRHFSWIPILVDVLPLSVTKRLPGIAPIVELKR
jgi:cytochrome P450